MNEGHMGNFAKSSSPKVYWGGGPTSVHASRVTEKRHVLTSEMPHLCVFPRAGLCQDLARGNALQALGYVSVERILTAARVR